MTEKKLMKGNEAFAEAALRNGCRFYFGYPITPQNELTEYMSRELPLRGGAFVQAESELAAINMAYGGAVAGGRVMISSSSPGIALMQEGISFLCSTELPVVLINVSRGGPGIGTIQPGQADYNQATRGGGNGDYHVIVYAPASIQEGVDLIGKAFEMADRYRNPVMILADGMLGQMMEPVLLPEEKKPLREEDIPSVKPWALTGHKEQRPHNVIKSLFLVPEALEENLTRWYGKYQTATEELPEYELYQTEDAEIIYVAYGSTARIVKESIQMLREEGIKAGLVRPVSLWPFPEKAFQELGPQVKKLISVELSMGQMIQDVQLASAGRWPVSLINKVGGILLSPQDIVDETKKMEVNR